MEDSYQNNLKLNKNQILRYKQIYSYFDCQICQNIVFNPQECQNCQQTYCNDCLLKLDIQKCQILDCKGTEFLQMHRFAMNDLKSIEFECKNKQYCNEKSKYEEAIKHIQQCKFSKLKCKFDKCDEYYYGNDRQEHEKICQYLDKKCEKCDAIYYPNSKQEQEHKCLENLQKKVQQLKEKQRIRNMNIYNTNKYKQQLDFTCIQCSSQDLNQRILCAKNIQKKLNCFLCNENQIQNHWTHFQCNNCNRNYCKMCVFWTIISQDNKTNVTVHPHHLIKISPCQEGKFKCEGQFLSFKCFSGMIDDQSIYQQGFKCSQHDCNYHLCLNCVLIYNANQPLFFKSKNQQLKQQDQEQDEQENEDEQDEENEEQDEEQEQEEDEDEEQQQEDDDNHQQSIHIRESEEEIQMFNAI